jgi:hypothetical protein
MLWVLIFGCTVDFSFTSRERTTNPLSMVTQSYLVSVWNMFSRHHSHSITSFSPYFLTFTPLFTSVLFFNMPHFPQGVEGLQPPVLNLTKSASKHPANRKTGYPVLIPSNDVVPAFNPVLDSLISVHQ